MKILLPQGSLEINKEYKEQVLVVAGGRAPTPTWLSALDDKLIVYAADKGGDYCVDAQRLVSYLYGDQDSSQPDKWQQAARNAQVKTFPVAKDATDLELLLEDLPQAALLIATGVWGGRSDHLWANVAAFCGWQRKTQGQVILADQEEIMVLLRAGQEVSFTAKVKPLAVSVLPGENDSLVTLQKVRWPLENYAFGTRGPGYTVSNTMMEDRCEASCLKGTIGLYFSFS